MHVRRIVLLGGMLLMWLGIQQPVRGQTTGPSATPTPSPTPVGTQVPSADALLKQMAAADLAKKTVHLKESLTLTSTVVRDVSASHGDESLRKAEIREYGTDRTTDLTKQPPRTKVTHSAIILVKTEAAIRENHKAWQCVNLKKFESTLAGSIGSILNSASITEANLGTTTVDEIPVWHVQVTVSLPGFTTPGQPAVEDMYISQADNTLVQETTSLTSTLNIESGKKTKSLQLAESVVDNYSKYGESVRFRLPAACRSKKRLAASISAAMPALMQAQAIDRFKTEIRAAAKER